MLTLSDSRFTTQASASVRAATATGSSPTATEASCVGLPASSSEKTSSLPSGVFTASSRSREGVSATGRTWPDSKFVNSSAARAAGGIASSVARQAASRASAAVRPVARSRGFLMSRSPVVAWEGRP